PPVLSSSEHCWKLLRGGQSPVFMRVRRTAPMFTFNLLERFVNDKSPISTDICGVLPKLFPYRPIFTGFLACQLRRRASALMLGCLCQHPHRDAASHYSACRS